MGVNNLLNIGNHALFANQTAISVTGNNIANVNTVGYSRQSVRFEEFAPINHNPGQLGMGAYAAEVYRHFNRFVEDSFIDRHSMANRYNEQKILMQSVESLFNESNSKGLNNQMSKFFKGWQDVSQFPDEKAGREALLAQSESLAYLFRDTTSSLKNIQKEMDQYIGQTVNEVNNILETIRKVNLQIMATEVPGRTNANTLLDERDRLTRKLAEYVDIEVTDNGAKDYQIRMKSGMTLLQGSTTFSLEVHSPKSEKYLSQYSKFEGDINFTGEDSSEYTLEVVGTGKGDQANFRLSLDGGKTWLRDENGAEMLYTAPPTGESIKVKDLTINFTDDNFTSGDRFTIVPKNGLYWREPSRDPLNITPQMFGDGTDNPMRLLGGKLAAYYNVRDNNSGRYADKLDALANAMIWEVNKIHSQGAGLKPSGSYLGTQSFTDADIALGKTGSGLAYADRLIAGNFNMYIYDDKGDVANSGSLDFDQNTPGVQNFDPSVHSINDVVDALNDPNNFGNQIHASLQDGKLVIEAHAGFSMGFNNDSSGLLAALGINCYFTGSDASSMGINPEIRNDPNRIAVGKINSNGIVNPGDNSSALEIAKLATAPVRLSTTWEISNQSLSTYYSGIVGLVGSETSNAIFNAQYNTALANDIDVRIASISGVNLDEEMTSLIKFQHSYTAAAKLITTADEMLQTLLGLKQ